MKRGILAAGPDAAAPALGAAPDATRRTRRTRDAAPRTRGARLGVALPTLAAGLAAALPTLVSTLRALHDGIAPNGDRAIIAARSYDVLSAHPPLVGQYSATSNLVGQVVHSPGPLLYWLLALPARYGSPSSLALTIGLVNVLAIFGCVALARRRGGVALMLAVALALALVSRSFAPETLHDIWNPSAGLFPFTLLLFLCWSLACGDRRLLPLTALVASFAIQAQLTFLAPCLGVLAVGVGGLALLRIRAARGGAGADADSRTPRAGGAALAGGGGVSGRVWPWALAALLVLAVCWSAPVIDQLERNPGNFTLILRAARAHDPKLGAGVGWHAVVRAVGLPPWWLQSPRTPFSRLGDVRGAPGGASVLSAIALLAALALALIAGVLRRRADVAAGALIGFVLCAALGAVAAATPTRPSLVTSLGYTLWFGSQVGMWVWLMLGFAAIVLVRVPGRSRTAAPSATTTRSPTAAPAPTATRSRAPGFLSAPRARSTALLAGLAATLALGVAIAVAQRPDEDLAEYRPIGTIDARVLAAVGPGRPTIRVTGSHSFTAFDLRAAVVYALRRRGLHVLTPAAAARLGPYYEPDVPYTGTVYVSDLPKTPPGRVIARVPLRNATHATITVTYLRGERAGS